MNERSQAGPTGHNITEPKITGTQIGIDSAKQIVNIVSRGNHLVLASRGVRIRRSNICDLSPRDGEDHPPVVDIEINSLTNREALPAYNDVHALGEMKSL